MATKIFYNDNRIIIDGHAESAEECKAITAMCDSLANDENFKTIVYEEGHAVFEQVSGGESEMFAALEAQVAALKQQVDTLSTYVETLPTSAQFTELEASITVLESKPNEVLPYTASQLATLLAKLENLE